MLPENSSASTKLMKMRDRKPSKGPIWGLRIGTRGSALARWQATWVGNRLQKRFQGTQVEYVLIKTKGDKMLDVPLAQIGGKALFVKEIEDALLANTIDIAVHSVKDIPTNLPESLWIRAIARREDPRDVLISKDGKTLQELKKGARVGTSSLRRRALLLRYRKDIEIVPLRGNLDTRLGKLTADGLDAVLVAAAGMRRMGLDSQITEYLPCDEFIPAIGQGALGIETRVDDQAVNEVVSSLDHLDTRHCVQAERAFLRRLQGGCQVPIGCYARITGEKMILHAMVAAVDGEPMFRGQIEGDPVHDEELGIELAEGILRQGARKILKALYGLSECSEDL
jgi:hydroxymethylbilane synthase